jgi:CPA2 family monovalent cation:H+ antiporter-2
VRGRTGATVLVISRPGGSVMVPSAGEVLAPGDVLVLAGTHEAVDAARELLGAEVSSRPRLEVLPGPAPSDRAG